MKEVGSDKPIVYDFLSNNRTNILTVYSTTVKLSLLFLLSLTKIK